MRNHDIERLKQAAARYKADAYSLSDVEELTDYAIDKLDEPSGVYKVDNGDGTVTIRGLPVTVPSTLIPEGEVPIEVRSRCIKLAGRWMNCQGTVTEIERGLSDGKFPGELRIILAPKPKPVTWHTPASLPEGEYRWDGVSLSNIPMTWATDKRGCLLGILGADWTDPPKPGRYRKVGSTATWIGE